MIPHASSWPAPTVSPAASTPTPSRGWTPGVKKVAPPVLERVPPKPNEMTFSELLSGFQALRGAASGDVEVKRFEALVKAADALPIQGGPFEASYQAARSEAASRLGLQGYDQPNLLEKLFGAKPKLTGALPLPPGEVAFDPKTTKPGGTNQVLTAALSSIAYEESRFDYDTSKPFGPLHDHVKALGFTAQSLTDGVTRIAGPTSVARTRCPVERACWWPLVPASPPSRFAAPR